MGRKGKEEDLRTKRKDWEREEEKCEQNRALMGWVSIYITDEWPGPSILISVANFPSCLPAVLKRHQTGSSFINNWALKQNPPPSTFKDTLSPCQGRLPRRKYMNIWPRASKSSRRLCSKREDRSHVVLAVITAERSSKSVIPSEALLLWKGSAY